MSPDSHPEATPSRRRRSTSIQLATTGSSKKPRVGYACEACRNRKIACNGASPCARCIQDDRECVYVDRPNRTPLTRVRMTELEERISVYEQLWALAIPGFTLEDAYRKYQEMGVSGVRSLVHQYLPRRAETRPHSGINTPRPPTRARSPADLDAADLTPLIAVVHDPNEFEWHEGQVAGALDGMGVDSNTEEGVSYLGLSSGSTFVNVIKRLTPAHTLSVSPENFTSSNLDVERILRPTNGNQLRQSTKAVHPLPPLSEILPFVDCYFQYFHTLTPLVHEPTIRAQITGALPISTKPGQEVLIFMVFAMGAFDLATDDSDLGHQYYEIAHKALQHDLLEEGSLQLVQGLAIMANYLQRSNRPNAGHLTMGLAIRMAVGLGLHTPLTSWRCSPLGQEMRSRVWWALVTMEAGCSVTFGRPPGVGRAQLRSVPLPINCDDQYLTVSTVAKPANSSDVTLYSALITQSTLAQVTCSVHEAILQSRPAPTLEQIKVYDARIVAAVESLPSHCKDCPGGPHRFAHCVQVWRVRDFRAILYRPILLAAAWDTRNGGRRSITAATREAIEICRTLALDNLHDIGEFFLAADGCSTRVVEWYTLYFAFQSALAILLSVVWEPSHVDAEKWRSAIHSTASWFRQMRSLNNVGHKYAQILENIVNTVPTPTETHGLAAALEAYSGLEEPAMDVDRYWLEIMGNELALPNVNQTGWWDQFIQAQSEY